VRPFAAVALSISVALVLAAGFPWGDLAGHTHWSRVNWIPFAARLRPFDVGGNLLLCAPLGIVAGREFRQGVLAAGAMALVLSLFVEASQLFSHLRFPSATDVCCNVAGAIVAAVLVRGTGRTTT
jgi:glycopeptide antibiotics resistance protein